MASNSQHHREKLSQYLNSHQSKSKNPVLNGQTSKVKFTVVQKKSPTSNSNRPKLPHIPQPHFKKKTSVDDLPDEILSFIFWKLPVGDLINASQTCKRWHAAQADNLLWQRLYVKFAGPLSDEAIAETPVCELNPGCWKNLCLKRCKLKRDAIYLKKWRKSDSYTGLTQRPENSLGKVGVRFELSVYDNTDVCHTVQNSDLFWSNMSLTVRWYSLVFPNISSIRDIRIHAVSPLMFYGPTRPARDGWEYYESKDFRQVDGEVAFMTVTFHNHNLVSRCLCGHVDRIWIPPEIKPIEDDIDPNYGLHGYTCVLLLRNMRQQLLEFKSTDMYCSKDRLNDGFASYTLVKKDDKLSHVVALKELSFPWKTELFKGIIKGVCILNLTLLDERGQPFWTISSFVQVCQSVHTDQFEFNPGSYCSIDYSDDVGKLHAEIGKLDDSQEYLSSLKICLSLDAINQAFKTEYK